MRVREREKERALKETTKLFKRQECMYVVESWSFSFRVRSRNSVLKCTRHTQHYPRLPLERNMGGCYMSPLSPVFQEHAALPKLLLLITIT